ncbi:MAG: AbrB/MazE/SpoVT family DNA-binding domain-containing protein [Gammaproteobacteria bacterium]
MRITTKGQVTIPQAIRAKLGLTPHSEVHFIEDSKGVYLVKAHDEKPEQRRFRRLRGVATVKMTTEEIMALTRAKA